MTHAGVPAGSSRRRRNLAVLASTLLLVAIPSAHADFDDPFATLCSKQAEEWHKLEIDAGNAIIACSDEFSTQEPTLCGYIGRDGNCTKQADCEDGGVGKVECPAGASRSGGCCLIPKLFDCSGPNGTCITTNGGPQCQNTCDEIPMPPAPAPGPMEAPTEAPLDAPLDAPLPAETPAPAPEAAPLPAPEPVALEPAVGPAEAPLAPAEEPAVGPSEVPMAVAEEPVAEGPEAEGLAPGPVGVPTIGTREIGIAPVTAEEGTVEDDAGRAGAGGVAAASWAAVVAGVTAVAAAAVL